MRTRSVVAIPDVLENPEYATKAAAVAGGFRSVLAVPLIREASPIGAIAVGRPEPGPFSDKQIALLQTFADQAVIAIENVRLFKELEAKTTELMQSVGELRALGEVGQAVSSTLDLETVLGTIVSRATQLTGMDGGSIYEYDEAREEFYLHTTDGLPDELVEALRAAPIRKGEGALGRMAVTGEPVQIRDIADEGSYQSRLREILLRSGYRSLLAVPAAAREPPARRAGRLPQHCRRVRAAGYRAAEDLRDAVGARDPECATLPGDRSQEPGARDGEPPQERVSRQHVARAAHAA